MPVRKANSQCQDEGYPEWIVGKLDIEKLRPAEPGQLLVCALSGNNPIGLLSSTGSSITWFHLNHIR
jgi:hypothetical protein